MALTNLTGTEWVFNDVLDTEEQNVIYYLNFQSNNEDFIQLRLYNDSNYSNEMWYRVSSSTTSKYVYENGWSLPLYKTIAITGGTDVTNSDLITWLKANATWINQPQGVFVSYSGSEIATMEESGTKTLLTSGKYCEDDIVVEYTKPTPKLQEKAITPTTSQQVVTSDTGYDGLSEVTVNAMPSGIAGTPTATKGTVSNHSISITPSVTNTTGYITGGTINGTPVTIDVTELESGTKSITENGTGISVSGYSAVDVDVPGQEPTGVKYVYTDVDGVGAWDVSGYAKCSVNGAPVNDGKTRLTVKVDANDTISISSGGGSEIDWGDGTTTPAPGGTSYVTFSHTYINAGYYRIILTFKSVASRFGSGAFTDTDSQQKAISVEINYDLLGQNYRIINTNCFAETTITIAFMIAKSIGVYAFQNCKNLTTVIIENSANTTITSIGDYAFSGCSALKKLIIKAETPPTLGTNVFTGATESLAIYVPYSADHSILAAYQSATNWSTWASYIQEEPQ